MTRSRAAALPATTTMGGGGGAPPDNHGHLGGGGGVDVVAAHEEHDTVMPGFRFHPTEEELIEFYLRRKVDGKRFNIDLIALVDLYLYDPWDLPALASIGDKEWFFYVPRDRKYRNGDRPNRVTPSGYWKATGADRTVSVVEGKRSIGLKKTLVFYVGKAPKGLRSSWIMNEYRLPHADTARYQKLEISLCRVYKRPGIDDNFHLTGTTTRSSGSKAAATKHTAAHRTSAAASRHQQLATMFVDGGHQPSALKAYNTHGTNVTTAAMSLSAAATTGPTPPPMFGSAAASVASLSSTTTTEEDGTSLYHLKGGNNNNSLAMQHHAALLNANSSAMATIPIDELSRAIGSYTHANPNQPTPPPLLPFPSMEKIWDWNHLLLESPKDDPSVQVITRMFSRLELAELNNEAPLYGRSTESWWTYYTREGGGSVGVSGEGVMIEPLSL